jgi:hypothetical protein
MTSLQEKDSSTPERIRILGLINNIDFDTNQKHFIDRGERLCH